MTCDYCDAEFDQHENGIVAGAESGSATLSIDGVENRRNDEGYISFCSIECFKLAEPKYSWGYNYKKCPLINYQEPPRK